MLKDGDYAFMKALVVGCGNIGSVAAEDLARTMKSAEVVVADNDKTRAEAVAKKIGTENISSITLNVSDHEKTLKTLKNYDVILGFLPGKLGYRFIETCIDAGKDLVDVSYMAENPLELNSKAVKAGVTIVPDCGLAPGISNFLVGHAASKLDNVKAVHIMVGGLPETPIPPLGYVITWSPESLIDEYTRKAGIIQKNKKVEVEALTGLEEIVFPIIGRLEAFYTDGLRTLMHTIKGEEMWEKTLRYPNHAEKIKTLEALGFFDEKPVSIGNAEISPRKLAVKLLAQKLWRPEIRDVVALKTEVLGVAKDKQVNYAYQMLDFYDKKHGITAMARTTAYPASIVAQMLLRKAVKEKGIAPPEKIGAHDELFKRFIAELESRGIHVSEETAKS